MRASTLLSLIACLILAIPVVTLAQTGIPDPCLSTAAPLAPGSFVICPLNDGQTLGDAGLAILVQIVDGYNLPISNIPPSDLWLIGCFDLLNLCGGALSSNADTPTDANGQTWFQNTTIWGGGHEQQLAVVVQGVVLLDFGCSHTLCLEIEAKSPDINADLVVNLQDVSLFATGFPSPPNPLEPPFDFDSDGTVGLTDLSIFAQHYGHACGF